MEVFGLKQSLERAKKELGQLKKQLEDNQGVTTKVEALKKAVAEAEKKAAKEQAIREKHEARVTEVQQELQEAVRRCETLEQSLTDKESKLTKARQAAHDARGEAQGALQDIQRARKIVEGKAFSMQSKYVKERFLLLTRIRSSLGAFVDLPRSVSDAAQFYRAKEASSTEKLFWSQYLAPEHPAPFIDQLKQLVELHRAAELAMKDLIIRLWPTEEIPSSYFGLMKRLVSACPQLDAIKRSVCIEGVRMAFARAKVHSVKMDAVKLMTEGPPAGKEHCKPELYYDSVLEGSRLVVEKCAKDIIFP
ncbi:hypothetical protein VPH35_130073 [Triticum aestivum]